MSHNVTTLCDYPFQACWEPHNEREGEGPLDQHFQFYAPRAEKRDRLAQKSRPLISHINLAPDQSSEPIAMQECQYPTCSHGAPSPGALLLHWEVRHACVQCGLKLHSLAEISKHHRDSGHAPYACPVSGCTSLRTFTRKDALLRHARTKHGDACLMFACTQQGCHATFKRSDHLKQHLQSFHNNGGANISESTPSSCPHKDCEMYRDGAYHPFGIPGSFCDPEKIGLKREFSGYGPKYGPYGSTPRWVDGSTSRWVDGAGRVVKRFDRASHAFATRVDFQKHMRNEHNETPFECRARDCDRRRRHGFFRLRDLEVHQHEEHGAGSASELMKPSQAWFELVPKYFWGYVLGHKQYIKRVIKSSSADWDVPRFYHDVHWSW